MATPAAPPRIDLHDSFGACLIAVIVASALWGVSVVQAWYYFIRYPTDLWYIKLLVVATMISDTVHQALITHTIYWYLVSNYANPVELANMIWSILVEVVFNGITGFLVQSFLTYRVYRLSHKNWLVTSLLGSLVLALFSLTISFTVQSLRLVTFVDLHQLKRLSMSINALGATVDVLIAICLCFLLQKSRTGFKRSDSVISKLMLFTINTGLLTSICAVLSLSTILAFPNALIYVTFYFCLGRLYTNSLLATLNSRRIVSNENPESMSVSLGNISSRGGRTLTTTNNISIKIDTTKEFSQDQKEAATLTEYPPEHYKPDESRAL